MKALEELRPPPPRPAPPRPGELHMCDVPPTRPRGALERLRRART
jgi:hypothetical protein